jgi:hypothetical protein
MSVTIRAHYDGQVIVPDEPVELPVNQPLKVELTLCPAAQEELPDQAVIADRLKRLAAASGRISGPSIPLEALRRENLYEERM